MAQDAALRLGEDVQAGCDGSGSGRDAAQRQRAAGAGLSWAAALAAVVRGSRHSRGVGELAGGERARAAASAVGTVRASARRSWPPPASAGAWRRA
jgi:hypothetical protein